MIFYELKINPKTGVFPPVRQTPDKDGEEERPMPFSDTVSHATDEVYNKLSGQTCYITGVRNDNNRLFAVAAITKFSDQMNLNSKAYFGESEYFNAFCENLEPAGEIDEYEEITFQAWEEKMQKADRNGFIESYHDVFRMFEIENVVPNRSNCKFGEFLACGGDDVSLENFQLQASSLQCASVLNAELERIFQRAAKSVKYCVPVHYIVTNDSPTRRRGIAELLTKALYANDRLVSARAAVIRCECDNGFDSDDYDKFFNAYHGAAIIIEAGIERADEEDSLKAAADEFAEMSDAILRHGKYVQFIFSVPRSDAKLKERFCEALGDASATVVELAEEPLFGEKAVEYLETLAKAAQIEPDVKLREAVELEEHAYNAKELESKFDRWFRKKLFSDVYPQYAYLRDAPPKSAPKGGAYEELMGMVGLGEAKKVINSAISFYKTRKLFRAKGLERKNIAMHMMFTGNPGTAKTTVARLFAQVMKDNELLDVGDLVECGRGDLVGKYVGWTAPAVQKKFRRARGSVLFIDEAYSLVDDRSGSYGDEAISTIVQEMENMREDIIVIFAGYPDKMEQFIQTNPGLRSRVAFKVHFGDYDGGELYEILRLMASNGGMKLDKHTESKVAPILARACKSRDFGNGRFVRNMFERAMLNQAHRLSVLNSEDVTLEDVETLTADDFTEPFENVAKSSKFGFAGE